MLSTLASDVGRLSYHLDFRVSWQLLAKATSRKKKKKEKRAQKMGQKYFFFHSYHPYTHAYVGARALDNPLTMALLWSVFSATFALPLLRHSNLLYNDLPGQATS